MYLFDATVNGSVKLLFSICYLRLYRNISYFYILVLYSATLLNLLISPSSFLVGSLGFSTYTIRSSVNKDKYFKYLCLLFIFLAFYID